MPPRPAKTPNPGLPVFCLLACLAALPAAAGVPGPRAVGIRISVRAGPF